MLRALSRLMRRQNQVQLSLDFDVPSVTAGELLARLHTLGMPQRVDRLRLTRNRTVMVSFSGNELRIHEGFLPAPEPVLEAVVAFVRARTRAERARAREVILSYQIPRSAGVRRQPRTAPEDELLLRQLRLWHQRYNVHYFGGRLRPVPIRVSRRMKTRLGHYTAASPTGDAAEIAISRGHIQRHGWDEALHTLLHEMVHQWQDESGHAIDHGATFRAKAREVEITPFARRTVVAETRRKAKRPPQPHVLGLRAAREE